VIGRIGAAACAALILCVCVNLVASATNAPVHASRATVYVAGKEVKFKALGIAYNDPVAPADDPGVKTMLDMVNAQLSWQPGTRFVVVTRADGVLITLTVGSSALAVGGHVVTMPFAPFYDGGDLYIPMLPLAKALRLGVRGFKGGYVFVPQVVSIDAHSDARRTIVEMTASAPAAYRSDFDSHTHVLSISFPGFGTDAQGTLALSGRDGLHVKTSQSGPPGFPTTTVAISVKRGVHFAAHRASSALVVAAVLSKYKSALHLEDASAALGRVTRASENSPAPATAAPAPAATRAPATAAPQSVNPTPAPAHSGKEQSVLPAVPTARPVVAAAVPVPTAPTGAPSPASSATPPANPADGASPLAPSPSSGENASAQPSEAGSPSPSPPPDIRVTDVALNEIPDFGTRITLTMTGGPVNFEWHRLADPDNRYWIDIKGVTLASPAETMTSALPFIRLIRVTQLMLEPERIVRVAIYATQPINVDIGAVEQSSDQMGIQIGRTPPAAEAQTSGVGTIAWLFTPPPAVRTVTQRDLIAIDPGHGGNDPGSMNEGFGLIESHLTLNIAKRLRDDLRKMGWRVVMTRDADYEVGDPKGDDHQELQARCDVANAAGARVFVSVHVNSSDWSSLNGTTTYYWRPSDRILARAIQDAVASAVGTKNVGVKRGEYYVINHTNMPAILIETAFLSNSHDARLLQEPSFWDKVARGIAEGIMNYTGGPQAPL